MKRGYQPLVGILAGNSSNKHFSGNELAFQRIQLALQKNGGLSYVFRTDGFLEHSVIGYVYDFKRKKWIENTFTHPDVVYNKIPFRKYEQSPPFFDIKTKLHSLDIPYFNESYFKKWEIYELLFKNNDLKSLLPVTIQLDSVQSFESMSKLYKRVYLKPSKGKKGKGIFIIEQTTPDKWNIQTIEHIIQDIPYKELIHEWILTQIDQNYIIQQAITPLRWKGSRFDYRVLVHRKNEQEFVVSGIGVRQSQTQEVTTHVPAGGKIIPFGDLPFQKDADIIDEIVSTTGQLLLQQFKNIGEFSMDIGKDVNGDLYIYEVNSKPMVFDEDDIRRKGLEHLVKLFTFLSSKAATSFLNHTLL
ncbi:YheC/YheD family protein [Bacillus sp. DJP31]|uniref:YheC/YheD family protein n=1 Tax=Bacillus sp. DJP31 TaxID=3409789 RepID=UPI003BB6F1FE